MGARNSSKTSFTVLALVAFPCASLASSGDSSWSVPSSDPDGRVTRVDAHGRRAVVMGPRVVERDPSFEAVGPAMWTGLGPFGGDIDDVASSPTNANVVLAGLAPTSGGGGLFRSTDAGATWSEVAQLSGTLVHDIEFDSAGTAYIGTLNSVWRSTDDGASWTQSSLGIGLNDEVLEVTVDPGDDTRIWIGVADALGSQPVNVLQSIDSGLSWTDRTPPLGAALGCTGIALDPANSNEVYACFGGGFGGGAVWVSIDGGATWTDRSAGLPGNPMTDVVHDGARVLLGGGQLFGSQLVGLYSTSNLGVTWTPLHDGTWPLLIVTDVEVDPANVNTIYVGSDGQGVYRSTDGGASWSFGIGGTGSLAVREVHVDAASSSVVYTGSGSNAVWKSADGGTSFGPSSVGIGALNVVAIAADPNDSDNLAVAFEGLNDGGVMLSGDGGVNWTLQNVPATRWSDVSFAPDGTPYAISDGPTTIAPEGLYRLVGGSWTGIGPDQGTAFESRLGTMRFSENDPLRILAGGSDFGVAGFEPTVWRSIDGGSIWTKTYEGAFANESVTDIEIREDGTDLVLVASYTDLGTTQDGGALRSIDGGASWGDSSTGLAVGAQGAALCPSPIDPDTFYLADDDFGAGGLFVTNDGGQTWSGTGYAVRTLRVDCDPQASVLYAAQRSAPWVLVSDDFGATFAPFDTGLASIGTVRDMAFADDALNSLLLATTTGAYSTVRCGDVETYCTGKTNSLGCVPFLTTSGLPSASDTNPFSIIANDLVPNELGLLVYSFKKSNLNFHGGKLCVKAPTVRWFPNKSAKVLGAPPCTGRITRNFNNRIQSGADPALTPGARVHVQFRQREPNDPAGFGDGLTNAVRFVICP